MFTVTERVCTRSRKEDVCSNRDTASQRRLASVFEGRVARWHLLLQQTLAALPQPQKQTIHPRV